MHRHLIKRWVLLALLYNMEVRFSTAEARGSSLRFRFFLFVSLSLSPHQGLRNQTPWLQANAKVWIPACLRFLCTLNAILDIHKLTQMWPFPKCYWATKLGKFLDFYRKLTGKILAGPDDFLSLLQLDAILHIHACMSWASSYKEEQFCTTAFHIL